MDYMLTLSILPTRYVVYKCCGRDLFLYFPGMFLAGLVNREKRLSMD